MIHGDNFTVDMDNPNLPVVKTNFNYPVLYNGGLPAEIRPATPIKNPWFNKIKTIKWSDFFEIEKNKMVVYQITPHASVTNNNKRLWRAIHKMYELYESPGSRLEREGFKLTYREKDLFFYDVIFRQEKGDRKIEFYITTTEYQANKLKRKIENKMSVTMSPVSLEKLQVPKENTIIQELKYLNHDIFSLNTNSTETKTPIGNILNVVEDLTFDGDFARLSICNEVESRQKWVKTALWAHEKISKGKTPMRANAGGKQAARLFKTGVSGLINEINELLTDTFQAFSNVFFKSDKEFKKEKVIPKNGLEDEISAKRMSGASQEKINVPVFKSRIRVAAHSADKLTRETLAEDLALSMADLTENNELQGVKVRVNGRRLEVIEELNTQTIGRRTKLDANVNLISTEEMNKIALQMPNQELQRKFSDELSAKKRVEIEIPKALRDPNGIPLGLAEVKDEKITVTMPTSNPDEFFRGYTFIGGQGAGKDTAIKNFVVEANLKHNISFVIPDAIVEEGSRGMADGIRDALPPDRVIDLNLKDDDYRIPLDLTEVVSRLGIDGADRFAGEVIDFLNMDGLTRGKKYLRESAKASGGSLYNIKRIIEDQDFRLNRIAELIDEGNIRLATELTKWGTNEELGEKIAPILSRLDDFFGNDRLFDIFSQPPLPELDFAKWMQEGKVIILRVPNGRGLGELAVKTLVHWITLKVFMTRLLMNKEEQKNGCFIVFNEPEQYQTEGLTKLMGRIGTEGRKERLGSIYAFHHWDKLQDSLQKNLQGGGVQQFLFMNDHTKTFEKSAHRFTDTIPMEQAQRLPAHHAIISVRAGGEMQPAFICHMAPPIKSTYDNSFLTKRHARMYGRHWQTLQQAL
jgi:hypothetical protein